MRESLENHLHFLGIVSLGNIVQLVTEGTRGPAKNSSVRSMLCAGLLANS